MPGERSLTREVPAWVPSERQSSRPPEASHAAKKSRDSFEDDCFVVLLEGVSQVEFESDQVDDDADEVLVLDVGAEETSKE